jgi:hypothetical protein
MAVRDHLEEAFELKAEGIHTEADGLFDPQSEYSSVGSRKRVFGTRCTAVSWKNAVD